MLISRKPYCNNCNNRGPADATTDYHLYPCGCEELAKKYPERTRYGLFYVTEKMRCPDKRFFDPIYTLEQVREHNHHK
jgi:hypothetical protein